MARSLAHPAVYHNICCALAVHRKVQVRELKDVGTDDQLLIGRYLRRARKEAGLAYSGRGTGVIVTTESSHKWRKFRDTYGPKNTD